MAFLSLSELHLPQVVFFDEQVSLGGALGKVVVFSLNPLFHVIGTALVLWSALLLVLIFYGQVFFFEIFFIFFKGLIMLFPFLFKKTPALMIWGLIKVKALVPFLFRGGKSIIFFFSTQLLKGSQWLFKGRPSLPKENQEEALTEEAEHQKELNFAFKETDLLEKDSDHKETSLKKLESKESELEKAESLEEGLSPLKAHSYAGAQLPSVDILSDSPKSPQHIHKKDVENLSKKLIDKLSQFSIKGEITAVKTGPAVVLFEFKPEDHIKVSRIREMESDLSLALSSESVRIIAPIPGRDVVGIEASRPYREMVYLKTLLQTKGFMKASLPLILGRRADNMTGIRDLARIPHLLVAGTTGSGKSIFVISFVTSLLFRHTPETLRLLLVDPKQVDLSCFKGIPHLLAPIINSSPKTVETLHWAVMEMEKRYRSLAIFSARDHKAFNEKMKKLSPKEQQHHKSENEGVPLGQAYYFEPLPLICIIIEEFGDLMADKNVRRSIESSVVRLAQKSKSQWHSLGFGHAKSQKGCCHRVDQNKYSRSN